jgi:hypothetical protein
MDGFARNHHELLIGCWKRHVLDLGSSLISIMYVETIKELHMAIKPENCERKQRMSVGTKVVTVGKRLGVEVSIVISIVRDSIPWMLTLYHGISRESQGAYSRLQGQASPSEVRVSVCHLLFLATGINATWRIN